MPPNGNDGGSTRTSKRPHRYGPSSDSAAATIFSTSWNSAGGGLDDRRFGVDAGARAERSELQIAHREREEIRRNRLGQAEFERPALRRVDAIRRQLLRAHDRLEIPRHDDAG